MSSIRTSAPVVINPLVPGKLTLVAEGELGSPKVSGNGAVVVWDQMIKDNEEIMRWKDGKVDNLSNDPHADIFPVPSRDGSVVAFTRFNSLKLDDPNGRWEIHENRRGDEHLVAKSDKGNLYDPAISGNGRVLAWDNDGDGRMALWNIQKQTVGGPVEDVTTGRNADTDPKLDHFGRTLIWNNGATGRSQVWISDGKTAPHAVAPSKGFQADASINPSGRVVIFADDSSGLGQATQVVDGEAHKVAPAAKQDQWLAAESAWGKHVVWSNLDRGKDPSPMELFIKDGDGAPVQLTDSKGGMCAFPTMSEDGKVITWLWVDEQNSNHARVYRFDRE